MPPVPACTKSTARWLILTGAIAFEWAFCQPAQALVINVTYDTSVTQQANAAVIENAFAGVVSQFTAAITNSATVNVKIGWGKVNNQTVPTGAIGSSADSLSNAYTYSQMRTILSGTGAVLPASNPAVTSIFPSGAYFYIPTANAKALGLTLSTPPAFDGYIGFDTSVAFSFSDTAGVAAGTYDFTAVAQHELSEVLGRTSGLITASPFYAVPADIFRYSAPGVNSFTYNTPNGVASAYASVDGGVTSLGTYNDIGTGDRDDWLTPGNTSDAQNAAMPTGKVEGLSYSDKYLLQAIGWTFATDTGTLFSSVNAPAGATPGVNDPVNTPEPASGLLVTMASGSLLALRRRTKRHPRRV